MLISKYFFSILHYSVLDGVSEKYRFSEERRLGRRKMEPKEDNNVSDDEVLMRSDDDNLSDSPKGAIDFLRFLLVF